MTVRSNTQIHFGRGDVSHYWRPAKNDCHAYGVIKFGEGQQACGTVFFDVPEQVDEVIAELTALRAEMTGENDGTWRLTPKGEAALSAGAPRHATGYGETSCGAEDSNYICTAQDGHDGPDHVAYGPHGEVCHRWPAEPASAQPAIAEPESSYDLAIRQAEFFAQPGNTVDDVLAAQREAS